MLGLEGKSNAEIQIRTAPHAWRSAALLVPTRARSSARASRACYRETTRDLRYVRIVGNDLRCGSIVCTVVLVGQGGYDTHGHTASDTLRAGADTR